MVIDDDTCTWTRPGQLAQKGDQEMGGALAEQTLPECRRWLCS